MISFYFSALEEQFWPFTFSTFLEKSFAEKLNTKLVENLTRKPLLKFEIFWLRRFFLVHETMALWLLTFSLGETVRWDF